MEWYYRFRCEECEEVTEETFEEPFIPTVGIHRPLSADPDTQPCGGILVVIERRPVAPVGPQGEN